MFLHQLVSKKEYYFVSLIGCEIWPLFNFFKISNISFDKDFELIQPKLPLFLDEDEILYFKADVSKPSSLILFFKSKTI